MRLSSLCDTTLHGSGLSLSGWSETLRRVEAVDPFGYGVPPSPNRACTFQRTRLSTLVFPATSLVIVSIRMTPFGLGHKDCLSSPQRPAFACVTTAYTLADPECSGCSPHYRQTL